MNETNRQAVISQRIRTAKADQKAALIALGRDPSDVWKTYPEELRGVGALQEVKTVNADPNGMEILPDDGYEAMLKVILKGEPNLLDPLNFAVGLGIWGNMGAAVPALTEEWPIPNEPDLPTEENFDAMALAADPSVIPEDKFVLVEDDGVITVGYMLASRKSGTEVQCNNLIFPTHPEYDGATYPHAYILRSSAGAYFFCALSSQKTAGENGYISSFVGIRYKLTGGVWTTTSYIYGNIVWTNTDTYYSSTYGGSLYMAATEIVSLEARDAFAITAHDADTTEFQAISWLKASYHPAGEYAGQITTEIFAAEASQGNFFQNMRYCARRELYDQNGVGVWPERWQMIMDATSLFVEGALNTLASNNYIYSNGIRLRVGDPEGNSINFPAGTRLTVDLQTTYPANWAMWFITSSGAAKIEAKQDLILSTDYIDTNWMLPGQTYVVPEDTQFIWLNFRNQDNGAVTLADLHSFAICKVMD